MKTAYLFQTFLIVAWWIGILQSDSFYKLFEFKGMSKTIFHCFFLPDLAAIAFLSLLYCYTQIKGLKHIILGAFLYATLFCFSITFLSGGGEISSISMMFGLFFNLFLTYKPYAFRSSQTGSPVVNLSKTIVQVICIWFIFLIAIPYFILRAEDNLTIHFEYQIHQIISVIMFCSFSVVGLWSGYTLSVSGEGTPLPFDATNKLVITGPYSYIRNPMAVCGIGQGMAIAMFTQSISVLVYCLIGCAVWNWVIRKFEEEDLTLKYGKEYIQYCQSVKCWIPTFPRYDSQIKS